MSCICKPCNVVASAGFSVVSGLANLGKNASVLVSNIALTVLVADTIAYLAPNIECVNNRSRIFEACQYKFTNTQLDIGTHRWNPCNFEFNTPTAFNAYTTGLKILNPNEDLTQLCTYEKSTVQDQFRMQIFALPCVVIASTIAYNVFNKIENMANSGYNYLNPEAEQPSLVRRLIVCGRPPAYDIVPFAPVSHVVQAILPAALVEAPAPAVLGEPEGDAVAAPVLEAVVE